MGTSVKLGKAGVRVWTRLYTWGMPPHVRDARRAEIESDLWEHEHDLDSDLHLGPTVQLLSRLILGVPYDLQWRLEQGMPHLQSAVAAGPAPRPLITTSALTCSLVIHVLALAATVWLASRPTEQFTRNTAVHSTPLRPVELSDVGTATPARSEVSQAHSHLTNVTGSAKATHLGGTTMPIQTASVWKRIAGSVSRVAVTASIVLGIAPAPDLVSATQPSSTAFAVPVDPIVAILDAFRTHQIVAVSDPHGNEQAHAFRLALVRDPRVADVVNDIVVEFGNALHQGAIDRYVAGEDVPYESTSESLARHHCSSAELGLAYLRTVLSCSP